MDEKLQKFVGQSKIPSAYKLGKFDRMNSQFGFVTDQYKHICSYEKKSTFTVIAQKKSKNKSFSYLYVNGTTE